MIDLEQRLFETIHLASTSSHHFGQLVWAKLASAPFWPAVIFTEENQDWIRHKGSRGVFDVHFIDNPVLD